MLDLQRSIGNQALLRLLGKNAGVTDAVRVSATLLRPGHDFARIRASSPGADVLQAKPAIDEVEDKYEREANRVADRVTRMPEPKSQCAHPCGGGEPECLAEKPAERHKRLQAKPVESGVPGTTAAPPIVLDVLRSPGRPLDPATRVYMEPRFGHDFSRVRIHSDAAAEQSARELNARAYTVGHNIVFDKGRFAPGTVEGRQLLAHELTHTMQQEGSGRFDAGGFEFDGADDPLEQQAKSAAERVDGTGVIPSSTRASGVRIQRSPQTPPATPSGIESRLDIVVRTGGAVEPRLNEIVRTGGPVPAETRVIGAAIVDVEGYTGPKEMRAISGAATDTLGKGAPVYHAASPTSRTLSATRGISGSGPRREFPFSHINDAEMKLFEDIIPRLPKNAKGTIHFTTVRVRQVGGQTVFEPYPACSGCIRASFETAGVRATIDLVSHAPTHPAKTLNLDEPQEGPAPKPAAPKTPVTTEPATPKGGPSPEVPPVATTPTKPPPAAKSTPVEPAPVVERPPAPAMAPPVRPISAWKAGLKAGGKALVVTLIFAGLEYLVHRRLEKDLEASIDKAKKGAMPWAQRLKREDPSKPVYMRVMVQSEDYTRYIPLLGWMPETPVLHMIQIAMVRQEIDPPIVEVQDDRFNVWHPGVTTTVTYTEPMVP